MEIGKEIAEYYEVLSSDQPIEIFNSKEQDERFYEIFQKWKYEVNEFVSEDLDGTVNRLGLIFHRIMMIFTMLRIFESGESANEYQCSDHDFENALRLVEVLKEHAIHVSKKLPSANEAKSLNSDTKKKVFQFLPDKFKRSEVEE